MTEKLRTLLHDQATAVDFEPLDLDAIATDGDRRIRRRRGLGLAGGLAVLAVVGALTAASWGDDGGPQVATEPLPTTPAVTWAVGSTLHVGGEQADLGHEVAAYVRTDAGYVFADDEGTVFSYADGAVEPVGTVSSRATRLVADSTGTLAGWVDPSGDRPAFVVLDQATGVLQRHDDTTTPGMGELADEGDPAYFYAIDGRTAYWRDTRGAVSVDLDAGWTGLVEADARNGFDLIDVEDGLIARYGANGVRVGRHGREPRPLDVLEGGGRLSPDAGLYAPDADALRVVDVETGQDVALTLPASYVFATGYDWLDDDTLAVIALADPEAPISLLTCTVSTGACAVVVDDAGAQGETQIAVGEHLG